MRKARIVLIALAGLWLVGELAVIPFAESRIERSVAERNRDAATVEADIDSFPMASRVLLTGRVKEVTVTLDSIARRSLTFAEVRVELAGIEVDRSSLLRREPKVTAIDRGTVTATIDLGELGGVLGRISSFLGIDVEVRGGVLHVGPATFPLDRGLFPCDADARVEDDKVIVSCTINDIPDAILDATQRGR